MKLFVDDIRRCPEGWVPARTVTKAIRILATQYVSEVSLDHDICCESPNGETHSSWETFEPVAYYISLMRAVDTCYLEQQRLQVRIHTANVEAGARMAKIIGISYNNEIYNSEEYK